MSTSENLEQQYDDVITYISAYRTYVKRLSSRVSLIFIRHPKKYLRLLWEAPSGWRQTNLLSGKTTSFTKKVWSEMISDAEKGSDYYLILMSDYPLHTLSISLANQFPQVDFEKLKKLHELKKTNLARFNIKQTLGVVLAAATILLKSIPESVVARVIDYKEFELITFWIATTAILYLFIVLLPLWWKASEASAIHAYANEVLEYTCIIKSEGGES